MDAIELLTALKVEVARLDLPSFHPEEAISNLTFDLVDDPKEGAVKSPVWGDGATAMLRSPLESRPKSTIWLGWSSSARPLRSRSNE